ncbi:MAG: hypothetical protein JXR44_00935 [Thiotrichales bacterium]|nr:hypothetical protein [Thiotrichales bacterium]
MQIAVVESLQGTVSVVSADSMRSAQPLQTLALNELLVTGDNATCQLRLEDGSLLVIGANAQLLLNEDLANLALDPETEASVQTHSFIRAVVELALADSESEMSQLLHSLTERLNQSWNENPFHEMTLLEEHQLYLSEFEQALNAQDLLAKGLNAEASSPTLTLEEAMLGEVLRPQAEPVQAVSTSLDKQGLLSLVEQGVHSLALDSLLQQLVQVVDISHYFSPVQFVGYAAGDVRLNSLLQEESLGVYEYL